MFALSLYLIVFGGLVFYASNVLNHSDNCILADPYETPRHVVPEWHFLPFFSILRCIPQNPAGISAMGGSIVVLFFIPYLNSSEVRTSIYRPLFNIFFGLFVADSVLLLWLGQQPLEDYYIWLGRILTVYYFLFLIILPLGGRIETFLAYYKYSM
jgi:quinol-cytochrome oxidoreductase complex cytochrome b subunit